MAVAVVTDSTSDLDPQRAAALGVSVVPLFVLWGAQSYRDNVDLTRAQFYEKLAAEPELPTTSQPSPQMFEDAFRPHAQAGDPILCVVISSKLSGTINAARSAAAAFPQTRIEIVDSESAAGGLGMQAMRAAEVARAGGSLESVLAAVEREKATQRLYACVPSLAHLVRTGRIGKARAAIGTLMKIVPVISLRDGEVVAHAQVRTMSRARRMMIESTLENVRDVERARLLVMHTNAPDLAASIVEELRAGLGGAQPRMLEVLEAGPVIATHAGPGAVGIFSSTE
ncbi:MAG TPA: DegV family protein [Candidatus Baltobacteraceae bacterium]|nr:DegV family protein [Candidatus Baltobacteraceae bacterium]